MNRTRDSGLRTLATPERPIESPALASATPPGTITLFARVASEAPAGTAVTAIDAAGSSMSSMTVGESGIWKLAVDGRGTGKHGELRVVQVAPDEAPVEAAIGPYGFELPQVMAAVDDGVVLGGGAGLS